MKNKSVTYIIEAKKIADKLLHISLKNENGIYWHSYSYNSLKEEFTPLTELDIFSGNSGILLFFSELYNVTKEKRYLKEIRLISEFIVKQNECHLYFTPSFYCGGLGLAYSLSRTYVITQIDWYKEESIRMLNLCRNSLENKSSSCEFLYGSSGTLLGLILIYNILKIEWLLECVMIALKSLLNEAILTPTGIGWGKSESKKGELSGFAHGATGIALALTEMYRITKNPALKFLIRETCKYEDRLFDKRRGNWKDLRHLFDRSKGIEEEINNYINGNRKFLKTSSDMVAWCHGSVGIGLARARMFEVLADNNCLEMAQVALATTKTSEINNRRWLNFCQCHGGAGNAELFLKLADIENKPEHIEVINLIADNGLSINKKTGTFNEDGRPSEPGLMNGMAGVGYFFLRIAAPKKVPSILLPVINSKMSLKKFNIHKKVTNEKVLLENLIRKSFGKTISIFKHYFEKAHEGILKKIICNIKNNTIAGHYILIVERLIKKFKFHSSGKLLRDIFKVEKKIFLAQENFSNWGYQLVRLKALEKKNATLLQLPREIIMQKNFVTSGQLQYFKTQYWFEDNCRETEKGEFIHLLIPTSEGVLHEIVSPFILESLNFFRKPTSPHRFIAHLADVLEEKDEQIKYGNQIYMQIINEVRGGLLEAIEK